jgi:hypothetical protein
MFALSLPYNFASFFFHSLLTSACLFPPYLFIPSSAIYCDIFGTSPFRVTFKVLKVVTMVTVVSRCVTLYSFVGGSYATPCRFVDRQLLYQTT